MKRTSLFENGMIWFGAGISIAEILTGTYLAPLGFGSGLAAILIGHLIGCTLMFLAGIIGARQRRSSMEAAKMSFGRKGAMFFSILNVLQLAGWTAIMIYDGAFSDARHYGTPKALGEERIDQIRALEIARAFVGEERVERVEAAPDSGGTLASYGVTLTLNDGVVLNAEVTRQGGKMLWMVPEHAAFTPALTLEECAEAAQGFLLDRGYGEMEANHYQVYDGLAVINFVAVQDGVLLYPDLVKVQIRMDTGEVVGLEANNYLMNHTRRTGLAPALSAQEALALTGYAVGGVCPFALPENIPVYLDVSLKRFDTVYPSAGNAASAVRLTCEELFDASGAVEWLDVCKGWQA